MPESNELGGQQRDNAAAELEAILATSSDAILIKNLDNIITSWSVGAERLYGYSRSEITGKSISVLIPDDYFSEIDEIRAAMKTGITFEKDTVRLNKAHERIQVSLRVVPVRDSANKVIKAVSIAHDLTGEKKSERDIEGLLEAAEERSVVIETANRVALDILSSRTGIEALSHIADAARTLAHAKYAALGVADPEGTGLEEFATVGLTQEEERAIGMRPRGVGILGLLLRRREPLLIKSIRAHPDSVGFPPEHPPMESFLGVPIRRGDSVLGSLYITEKIGGGDFTETDLIAVQALGAHAAVAIHNHFMMARQRALVSGLINAQEEERRAVAYDLHDGLTQYVMASHMHLEAFRMAKDRGKSEKANRELERGIEYLKEAVVESRRLVNGLRSLALDDLGLAAALELLINEEKDRSGWQEAEFAHNIAGQRFSKTLETTAYRVIQEALTNVRKHADATRVRILVLIDTERNTPETDLVVEVRDWGAGFNPAEKAGDYRHLGLQGMIERVQLLGGSHKIESAPHEGTRIEAVFPVHPNESGE